MRKPKERQMEKIDLKAKHKCLKTNEENLNAVIVKLKNGRKYELVKIGKRIRDNWETNKSLRKTE